MFNDEMMLKFKYLIRPSLMTLRYFKWVFQRRPIRELCPFSKRTIILDNANLFNCTTFIETGTYCGDTVAAMRGAFKIIMSVELYEPLYKMNKLRFKNYSDVYLWLGDSSIALNDMVSKIEGRALFWLDGHYSGPGTGKTETECPIIAELNVISGHSRKDHCILIDDARCFGQDKDYPPISLINSKLISINPNYNISIKNDIIVAFPPSV